MLELFDSFTSFLGSINLDNIQNEGDSNVNSTVRTIFYWGAIIVLAALLISKKFRMALVALIVLGIFAVFIEGPENIGELGQSILRFFGIMS